jgi:ribosomal protein S12 methylthiotransferase accessory factor
MIRPTIAPWYRIEVVGSDAVCVLAAGREQMLRGRVYALLVPLLDGSRTTDELLDRLEPLCDGAEIYFALDTLQRRRLVLEGGIRPSAADAYWTALGLSPSATQATKTRVRVTGIGEAPADLVTQRLLASGFEIAEDAADLNLVVTSDYLEPALADINGDALRTGRAWMLSNPFGPEPLTGPIFRPGKTACWECMAHRLRHHRPIASFVGRRGNSPVATLPAPSLTSTRGAAIDLSVALLEQSLAGHSTRLEDAIYSLDLATWSTGRHPVTRRPQCAACGSPTVWDADGPPDMDMGGKPGQDRADGGLRAIAPEETLTRYAHHVSPITGLVAKLMPIPGFDATHHVVMSGRNYAFPAGDLPTLRHGLRSMSSGKGISEPHARASALCESLERYSGVFQGDEPRIAARYGQIEQQAIHPNALLLFSERQFREREAWNGRGSLFNRIPVPFDEQQPVEWTPGWSMTRGARVYLPTAYCYYGYPADAGTRFSFSDSNGCAAGNTAGEAIVQAFLELVERDAVAIWWYNMLRVPSLDIRALGRDRATLLNNAYAERGREIWALDLTSDLGIPVFAAVSRRVAAPQENILFGFGCHLDPVAALLRAVTELNQGLSRVASAGFDAGGAARFGDPGFRAWWQSATLADHPYLGLTPDAAESVSRASPRDGFSNDISVLRRAVEKRGMEVILLDQTRPDVGLPVFRVVVPGLRHFWPRFAPGRLYDVPVALGKTATPLDEDALNPVAMFL